MRMISSFPIHSVSVVTSLPPSTMLRGPAGPAGPPMAIVEVSEDVRWVRSIGGSDVGMVVGACTGSMMVIVAWNGVGDPVLASRRGAGGIGAGGALRMMTTGFSGLWRVGLPWTVV